MQDTSSGDSDCPSFVGLGKYCLELVGGTLSACQYLMDEIDYSACQTYIENSMDGTCQNYIENSWDGTCQNLMGASGCQYSMENQSQMLKDGMSQKIAIHWDGGRHHAHADRPAGYCYVNDVVLGLLSLSSKYSRLLYIDLDVHHGDGVQEAFEYSKSVLTLDFHRFEPGFYPTSGSRDSIGKGKGKGYSVNVPFNAGLDGFKFERLVTCILDQTIINYKPQAIVVVCGADILPLDPLGGCNVDSISYGRVIQSILGLNLPTLFLGGGGYNSLNTALLYCYLTRLIIEHTHGHALDVSLPEDFSMEFATDSLHVPPTLLMDENEDGFIDDLIDSVSRQLSTLS